MMRCDCFATTITFTTGVPVRQLRFFCGLRSCLSPAVDKFQMVQVMEKWVDWTRS
ncbi:MAG TPA: hypothetical protein VGQ41_25865 [Pyrinomonadaceae bacterium]|nr:hypothetical protein [Pyrinomonadaceae bacterium]